MCPLVTRETNQGNFYKQATEPADWQDGDLWSDTNDNKLFLNVGGTATEIGGGLVGSDNTWTGKQTFTHAAETGSGGKLEHIGTYTCSSAESSHDFSSLSLDLDGTYSKLKLIISGTLTAAQDLQLVIDGRTTGGAYNFTYVQNDVSTVTGADTINQNTAAMFTSDLGVGAGSIFMCEVEIYWNGEYAQVIDYNFKSIVTGEGLRTGGGHMTQTSGGSVIDTIGFASSSNWKVGTQINLYGYRQ